MALDSTKWSVNPTTKEIAYDFATYPHGNAGVNYVTVLELHRWLQDLADDASFSNDDYIDITSDTPSDKAFDTIINLVNGYFISDTTAQYIYGGSIIQDDGGGESIFDGVRVVANQGVVVNVIQNNAKIANDFWNTVDDARKTASGSTVTGVNATAQNVLNVSDSSNFAVGQYITIGTVLDEFYQVDQIINGTSIRLDRNLESATTGGETISIGICGINSDPANGVAAQFMIKVKNDGAEIDNLALLFNTREWYYTYSEFRIPATGRGVNVVPLTFARDLNNTTARWAINNGTFQSPFSTINTTDPGAFVGFGQIDADNDGTDENYYVGWTTGTASKNQFYEYIKYIIRAGETDATNPGTFGLAGELFRGPTQSIAFTAAPTPGDFPTGATLTWGAGATAGSAEVLAYDGVNDVAYVQLLTGVVPGGSISVSDGTNSATTTASPSTDLTITPTVVGASTGSAIITAFGFGIIYADLTKDDRLLALDGITYTPPNNVTFTVSNLLAGYQVLVTPKGAGTEIDTAQMTIVGAPITGAAVTSLDVGTIPANTPATGILRVARNDGSYTRIPYTGITGTAFDIASTDFSTNSATGNVFIAYIDETAGGATVSYNTIQTTVQDLFVRVRFGGTGPNFTDAIKTFESPAQLTASGGGSSVVRTSDA